MTKIKILCLSLWYPLTMSRYFEKAFRHREDVDLRTTGPYTGAWIPWSNSQNPDGMTVPAKYAIAPDLPLPFSPNIGEVNYEVVKSQLGEWIPDIVLCIDAGIRWKYKPSDGLVVHVATDPHVLNYDHPRSYSDKFFNMQKVYSKDKDIYLPYAYSKYDVYPDDSVSKDVDAVLIGLQYTHVPRLEWINKLRERGVSVIAENGPIFDEARQLYNRGKIGLNWSSMDDLNCRAFEIPAFGLYPVMNYVPDLGNFKFQSYVDTFRTLDEAIEKVIWAKDNPIGAYAVASHAYQAVKDETFDARVEQLLKECGFI